MFRPSIKHVLSAVGYVALYYVGATISFAITYLILAVIYGIADRFNASSTLMNIIAVAVLGVIIVQLTTVVVVMSSRGFGIRLHRGECGEVHELANEVAQELGVGPFDRVYVVPDAFAGVLEMNVIPLLPIRRRNLVIGWLLLAVLSQQELKSVIAHELAHFDNNAMFLHRSIYRIRLAIQNSMRAIRWWSVEAERSQSASLLSVRGLFGGLLQYPWVFAGWAIIPYEFFVSLYLDFLGKRSRNISHEAEHYCDRVSAVHYGSNALLGALRTAATAQDAFYRLLAQFRPTISKHNNCYPLFYEFYNSYLEQFDADKLAQLLKGSHTHPSFSDRTANLAGMPFILDMSGPLVPMHNSYAALEERLTLLALAMPIPSEYANLTLLEEAL